MKPFNILNHVKIRTKLILFLVIPILTILFFSISGIYSKVQKIQDTRSSRNFTIVSLLLADLVHELQKERGLSAGFVGCSGQSFKEEVLKQRMQTDEKLGLFFQNLDINASGEECWGLSDKFTYLQKELYRLTVVRNAIDTLNDGDYFDFYSNLNAHAIDIIHYLQVFTNDASLARQGNAFSSLLRLQERAGQERGALNGIFASGKLDAKLFQEISAYVADQKAIFNNYYTIVSDEYQDMLRKKMRDPVVIEVEALRAAAINKSRRNELLNDIQIMIGYGGLIHDFKDYVIRGKDWYAERFSKFSIDAKNIIEQYRNLPGMSQEGIINLNKIETTFDQYQIILNDVIKMKESGYSITEIDELIDIDDKPAINAIKQLRKDVTSQDTSEWWEKATFRIELIKDVSDAIRLDIVYRTKQIIATTTKSASLSLVLSIITIAISFSLGYLLMRRPVEEIVNISTNMRNMQKHRDFDQQLLVGGHDEISDLANSFNEMINERKRAVEQIQILFHAIEQSSSIIIITDTKGNIKYGNPKLSQLTGYSIEEVIGKNPRILKSGKTPPETYKELWETITSGKEWRGEFCDKKKSGDLYWKSASISPVKDDNGVIINFIAVQDDITEQKRMQEVLKESEERYSKLIETAKDAIICDRNGTITDWNKSAEEVFGYSKHEIIGKQIEILVPDKYKKEHQKGLEQFLKTGETKIIGKTVEVSGITKEGVEIPIEISLTTQKIEEGEYYFTAFIRDLTERKKMEEALFQSEKLNSLGTIAAGIAHDFNNILTIISGKVQLFEMDYNDNTELTNELGTIMKAINDGVEISSRMLMFAKTEKDTTGFVSEGIGNLLEQSIDFTMPRWKNMAQVKCINYHIEKRSIKETPAVLCNPTELREAFINIINNALDAMPEGGSISFGTWSDDDTVFVEISDTGEGMSKEVKNRIFDPFFSTKGVAGTGLGMSMTYGIITRHGGKIEVVSEVDKGATFKLQFPIARKTVRSIVTPVPEQEIKKKCLRILVVDDEEAICNVLDKFLSRGGNKVKTVNNGADAVELSKREGFDLVLCDLAMPDMCGYDVINGLNDLEMRPKIGIITGWGEKLKAIDGEGIEVDFTIKKPFVFSELTRKINDVFGGLGLPL